MAQGTVYLEVLLRGLARPDAGSEAEYRVEVQSEAVQSPLADSSRIWKDIPVTQPDRWGDTNALGRLVGLFSLLMPTNGSPFARLRTAFGDIAYEGRRSPDAFAAQTYVLSPLPDPDMKASEFYGPVRVALDAKGAVTVTFESAALLVRTPNATWSKENPASAWIGEYHVALSPQWLGGAARKAGDNIFVSLKMTSAMAACGVMSYAGFLPNGKTFSGCSVLQRRGGDAFLPILVRMSHDAGDEVVAGILRLAPPDGAYKIRDMLQCVWADRTALPFWLHQSDQANNIVSFGAAGGVFRLEDMASFCDEIYETRELPLVIGSRQVGRVSVGANSLTCTPSPGGGRFSFHAAHGLFWGKILRDDGHIISYRGMLFPGWGSNCAVCGGPQPKRPSIPFGRGVCQLERAVEGDEIQDVRIGSIVEE